MALYGIHKEPSLLQRMAPLHAAEETCRKKKTLNNHQGQYGAQNDSKEDTGGTIFWNIEHLVLLQCQKMVGQYSLMKAHNSEQVQAPDLLSNGLGATVFNARVWARSGKAS